MKKVYVTPKAELLDFVYTNTVLTSGSRATTDVDSVAWTCNTWFVDTPHPYVCEANPHAG